MSLRILNRIVVSSIVKCNVSGVGRLKLLWKLIQYSILKTASIVHAHERVFFARPLAKRIIVYPASAESASEEKFDNV